MKHAIVAAMVFAVLFGVFVLDEVTNRAAKERLVEKYRSEEIPFVPQRHADVLQEKSRSCDLHDEGTGTQHLTCWFPAGGEPPVANYKLVGPTPWSMRLFLGRIREEQLIARTGDEIFNFVPMKEYTPSPLQKQRF